MVPPDVLSNVFVPEADMPSDVDTADFPPAPKLPNEPLGYTEPSGRFHPVVQRGDVVIIPLALAPNRFHCANPYSTVDIIPDAAIESSC
jgi:hypothetical protein